MSSPITAIWDAATSKLFEARADLVRSGMPAHVAGLIVDLNASIHNGTVGEDYKQHRPVMGKVKLEDFAKEFAAAFNA